MLEHLNHYHYTSLSVCINNDCNKLTIGLIIFVISIGKVNKNLSYHSEKNGLLSNSLKNTLADPCKYKNHRKLSLWKCKSTAVNKARSETSTHFGFA